MNISSFKKYIKDTDDVIELCNLMNRLQEAVIFFPFCMTIFGVTYIIPN